MLRKIQLAAAGVAAFLSVFALFDLVMERLGNLSADAIFTSSTFLTNLPLIPSVQGVYSLILGAALMVSAWIAVLSVWRSQHLNSVLAHIQLEQWRRLTWGTSIIETAGCLLFVFSGTLLFLPGAVALLLVGVAELATIMHEVEARVPAAAEHHPNHA